MFPLLFNYLHCFYLAHTIRTVRGLILSLVVYQITKQVIGSAVLRDTNKIQHYFIRLTHILF